MLNVDIVIKSKKWRELPDIKVIIDEIFQTVTQLTPLKKVLRKESVDLEIAIVLVGKSAMKKINFQHRQKNYATNVLSFPAQEIQAGAVGNLPIFDNYLFLGDVICCFEVLKQEAIEQNKGFREHLTHLILHSILHLIGFDHEDDDEAEVMESLEIKILKQLGIKNPY